jgi:ribosomal protein S18 acetylase RimI-like enzyme
MISAKVGMNDRLVIRKAEAGDCDAIWSMLGPVIRGGESYSLPLDLPREDGLAYWFSAGHEVFVAEADGEIAGTYFIQANQRGGGSHVANCGYLTAAASLGRGIGRAMCLHSLEYAKAHGYRAMQFNFVLSTNERAVRLWESFGFAIVGRLPEAYLHPVAGYVDVFVMYRLL